MTDLERLISWLLTEYPDGGNVEMPTGQGAQEHLLRALMNVWTAHEMPEEFWLLQNAVLKKQLARKGIVDADALPVCEGEPRIALWQGDITRLKAGAIVNAANSGMTGCYQPNHRCIDNCIHSAAGLQLRLACQRLMDAQGHEEATGLAKITPAYNLPSDFVVHTVGPIVRGAPTREHERLLSSCYTACLALAAQSQIQTIAFPCISTGVFGFPQKPAAQVAVETVKAYLAQNAQIRRVIFNVFTETDLTIYRELLGAY